MSLSRRSSPTNHASKCPNCGAKAVLPVTEDVSLRVHGRKYRFDAVEHERCAECGERIFGLEASRRFDAEILPRRRRVAR